MRPCLACGVLTNDTRCLDCYRARQRGRNERPERAIYKGGWQKHSRGRRVEDPWCTLCGSSDDLTVDHPTDAVLCRRCHSTLEARRRRVAG